MAQGARGYMDGMVWALKGLLLLLRNYFVTFVTLTEIANL